MRWFITHKSKVGPFESHIVHEPFSDKHGQEDNKPRTKEDIKFSVNLWRGVICFWIVAAVVLYFIFCK